MDQILSYINDSKDIHKYIHKVVPYQYKDDMMNHLILIANNMDRDKLNIAYKTRTLHYLMFRVISNQMDPKCRNCFYREVISPIDLTDYEGDFKDNITEREELLRDDIQRVIKLNAIKDVLRHLKPWKVEVFKMYYEDGLNYREISEKLTNPITGKNLNDRTVQRWVSEVREQIKKEIK